MTILGIDYGTAHVGLAIGDSDTKIALPYRTLHLATNAQVVDALRAIVTSENVARIVVGMPHAMQTANEHEGGVRTLVRLFAEELQRELGVPVAMADERLTSAGAKTLTKDGGADEHAVAAMLILQTHLDRTV